MQDIVGARFHCAICDTVDICQNCEAAGLPGNLDTSEGGHNSSHIMIKVCVLSVIWFYVDVAQIPFPLPNAELQSASERAKTLWSGRDAATGQIVRSRRNSLLSAYDRTILGVGSRSGPSSADSSAADAGVEDHGTRCDSCNEVTLIPEIRMPSSRSYCSGSLGCVISAHHVRHYRSRIVWSVEPRYHIPLLTTSQCAQCEERSYVVHDPMHVFFKFKRPIDRPLQIENPLIPRMYVNVIPGSLVAPTN